MGIALANYEKDNLINCIIWSIPAKVIINCKPLDIFFYNLTILRLIINWYGLQVSISLKTCKTLILQVAPVLWAQNRRTSFCRILCLQLSVRIIGGRLSLSCLLLVSGHFWASRYVSSRCMQVYIDRYCFYIHYYKMKLPSTGTSFSLDITPLHLVRMCFSVFYSPRNFIPKNSGNALIQFVQTLPTLRWLWWVQPPLSNFRKISWCWRIQVKVKLLWHHFVAMATPMSI